VEKVKVVDDDDRRKHLLPSSSDPTKTAGGVVLATTMMYEWGEMVIRVAAPSQTVGRVMGDDLVWRMASTGRRGDGAALQAGG
jgi:hypothetical protein